MEQLEKISFLAIFLVLISFILNYTNNRLVQTRIGLILIERIAIIKKKNNYRVQSSKIEYIEIVKRKKDN